MALQMVAEAEDQDVDRVRIYGWELKRDKGSCMILFLMGCESAYISLFFIQMIAKMAK